MSSDENKRAQDEVAAIHFSSIKTALIGFGFSAQTFHLPFLQCLPEFELVAVSSSDAGKVGSVLPEVNVYPSAKQLIEQSEAELVIITAPNNVHFELAKFALEAGKHVVVEKPFVTNSADGEVLIELSKRCEKVLSVYQNRRWDGDFLTIKKLIAEKSVGDVRVFESHFDRFRPEVRSRWRELAGEGSGIFFDLGPHLIDQTVQLFGVPKALTSHCKVMRENSQSIDFFHLILHYEDVTAILQSSPYCASPNLRFSLQGEKGSYVHYGVDPQEERLRAGQLPTSDAWAQQVPEHYGVLYDTEGGQKIDTQLGGYQNYFRQLAQSIRNGAPVPVSGEEALSVIRIIELAMRSSASGKTLEL